MKRSDSSSASSSSSPSLPKTPRTSLTATPSEATSDLASILSSSPPTDEGKDDDVKDDDEGAVTAPSPTTDIDEEKYLQPSGGARHTRVGEEYQATLPVAGG